jgi:hypothetical protein
MLTEHDNPFSYNNVSYSQFGVFQKKTGKSLSFCFAVAALEM